MAIKPCGEQCQVEAISTRPPRSRLPEGGGLSITATGAPQRGQGLRSTCPGGITPPMAREPAVWPAHTSHIVAARPNAHQSPPELRRLPCLSDGAPRWLQKVEDAGQLKQ